MVLFIKGIRITIIGIAAAFALSTGMNAAAACTQPGISAQSAVLLQDGNILYEKAAHCRMPMASLTKVMTAILVIENADLTDTVHIQEQHCTVEGSSMYLKPGSSVSVQALLDGLMLLSGNDAAIALAEHVSGDTAAFAAQMNRKAKLLGLKNTHFVNPHGLNQDGHYSTAYDLAKLMEYCMRNPIFAQITGKRAMLYEGNVYRNHNKLLASCPGCIGGNTGYPDRAGRCLISVCCRENTPVVCVTLSAPKDWEDHAALYDWCYETYREYLPADEINVEIPLVGEKRRIKLVPRSGEKLFVREDAEINIEIHAPWFAFKPLKAGEIAGCFLIYIDGACAGEYYLIYEESCE